LGIKDFSESRVAGKNTPAPEHLPNAGVNPSP
jgi:hypothetical protein